MSAFSGYPWFRWCAGVEYLVLAPRSGHAVQVTRFVRSCIIFTFRYPDLTFCCFVHSSALSTSLSFGAWPCAVKTSAPLILFSRTSAYEQNCRSTLVEESEPEVFWFLFEVDDLTCRILSNLMLVWSYLHQCDTARAWHSVVAIFFVTEMLPSSFLMYNGICGTLTEVQSNSALMQMFSCWNEPKTPSIYSRSPFNAHSSARSDRTLVIEIMADAVTLALSVTSFFVVAGKNLCLSCSCSNQTKSCLSSFGGCCVPKFACAVGLRAVGISCGSRSFANLWATVTHEEAFYCGFVGS